MINVKEFRKKHCKPKLKFRREALTEMYTEYVAAGIMNRGDALRLIADNHVPAGTSFVLPDNIILISPEDMNGLN